MAVTLGEYLHSLIKKAGQNPDDEAFKNFLLNGELMKIEIPEDVTKAIDNNLISLKDAKNNHPDIKPHYTELSLKTVDKVIEKLLEEFEVDETEKADILSESSTYKRVPKLVHKIKELEARKSIGNKDEKESIKKQIDELNRQLREEKAKGDTSKLEYENKLTQYKLNTEIRSLFGKYKTTLDDLDPRVKATTIETLLNQHLAENNAEIKFDENSNLVLQKKDGTNYYSESNQSVNPSQYLDTILSKNKLLITTNNGNKANSNGQQKTEVDTSQNGRNPNGGNGANGKTDHALKSKVQEALASYNTANAESTAQLGF